MTRAHTPDPSPDNQVHYPLHAAQNAEIGAEHWPDAPARRLGTHDGIADRLRESKEPF